MILINSFIEPSFEKKKKRRMRYSKVNYAKDEENDNARKTSKIKTKIQKIMISEF